mgnify:CR=1 FL=1
MSGLTAWERWELASFDPAAPPRPEAPPPEPLVTEAPAQSAPTENLGPTPEELEAIRSQAREEGYSAGRTAGHAAGYEAGQEKAKEEAQRLGQAADRLQQSLAELDQQVGNELLALAIELARQVVRGEISARPETILDVVREALVQLPHQHAVIHLHPEDASLVRSYLGDSLTHSGHRILEEPGLARGDCTVDAGGSQLDATVATRWRRVVESLGLKSAWSGLDEPEA